MNTNKIKILHVDDDSDLRDLFSSVFEPWFEIESVESGRKAVDILRNRAFDAVITDYKMPEMDGLELLRILNEIVPATPVVFYTALGDEVVAREAFLSGASDYIVMDFSEFVDNEKMVRTIEHAINKKREALDQEKPGSGSDSGEIKVFPELEEDMKIDAVTEVIDREEPLLAVIDSIGVVRSVNSAFSLVSGLSPSSAAGRGFFSIFEEDEEREIGEKAFSRITAGERHVNFRCRFNDGGSSGKLFNWSINRFSGVDSMPVYIAAGVLPQQNRKGDLPPSNNWDLVDFEYVLTHNMKNSINILLGYLNVIDKDPGLFPQHFHRVMDQGRQMLGMVDNMSRLLKAGSRIQEKKDVNLDRLVKHVFSSLKSDHVKAELVADPPLPVVRGDTAGLERVFINLIKNSFRFRDPGKDMLIINIEYIQSEDHILITFRDNGQGIKREFLNKVFNLDFSLRKDKSAGFGLAVARKIIDAHQGKIWVDSRGENSGAEFHISLPLE